MKYLTTQKILAIHFQAVERFGGSHGIRDIGLIESAVARPQASFDGKDLYKTIFQKAAALLQSILKNHAFVDGNKRTALSSAAIFLYLNGYEITNTHEKEVGFVVKVDNQNLTMEQIASWLKKNSKKAFHFSSKSV